MLSDRTKNLCSFKGRKALGFPNMFGTIIFGWSQFGDENEFAGIYRVTPINNKLVQQKMYFFDNPVTFTTGQTATRTKFANAVLAWQNLALDEKKEYNRRAEGRRFFGYHLFISEYMKL